MNKKKLMGIILVIGIILMGGAGYLYYKQELGEGKKNQTISNTTEEEDNTGSISSSDIEHQDVATEKTNNTTTEELKQEFSTTTEKKQNASLPDNYEWDEKQWGEPPQIVYDFAENQEKFDFIVNEVDSLLSEGEGFTTRRNNDKLYSESENGEQLKKNVDYLLNNTKFYKFTKVKYGHWFMYYNQEEDSERYIYYIAYAPEMTEEEAWDNGYMKVVGDWYFATVWKI